MLKACLERCDARTLRELKAVSAAWQRRAREVLCDAASAWRQHPIWSPSAEGRALAAPLVGEDHLERFRALKRMVAMVVFFEGSCRNPFSESLQPSANKNTNT